jgi:hypothetical protein
MLMPNQPWLDATVSGDAEPALAGLPKLLKSPAMPKHRFAELSNIKLPRCPEALSAY